MERQKQLTLENGILHELADDIRQALSKQPELGEKWNKYAMNGFAG